MARPGINSPPPTSSTPSQRRQWDEVAGVGGSVGAPNMAAIQAQVDVELKDLRASTGAMRPGGSFAEKLLASTLAPAHSSGA